MECGFDRESGEQALGPLFIGNCLSVAQKGPMEALTGPVERADAGTVKKHLGVLCGPERDLYRSLSGVLVEIAGKKHPQRDYGPLSRLLEKNGEENETHSRYI